MEKITRRMISSITFHQDLFGPNLNYLSQINKILPIKMWVISRLMIAAYKIVKKKNFRELNVF